MLCVLIGDSNEYTQYTIFNMKKKYTLTYFNLHLWDFFVVKIPNLPFQYEKGKHPNLFQSAPMGFFSKGLKNEFKAAVVNEPLVFEPLEFSCTKLCPRIS